MYRRKFHLVLSMQKNRRRTSLPPTLGIKNDFHIAMEDSKDKDDGNHANDVEDPTTTVTTVTFYRKEFVVIYAEKRGT